MGVIGSRARAAAVRIKGRRGLFVPIARAAKRMRVARPTVMNWLAHLGKPDVYKDPRRRWFLRDSLVERLRGDLAARRDLGTRAFKTRSRELARLRTDVQCLR